jgi:hypothetical protein
MKYILSIFLLFCLYGCSSKSPLEKNRVRLEFRDSVSHEYHLLSIRDSGLVVMPGYYDLKGPAEFISFSKLYRAYYHTGGKSTGMWAGGITGFIAPIVGLGIYASSKNQTGDGLGLIFAATAVAYPGAALGVIIGYLVTTDEDTFDLSTAHDRDVLRQYSIFPNEEPPELQKIK